jgi:alkylation response protein AidB-like acyl-CoA dehydrogenase
MATLTEEQRILIGTVRRLAQQEIAPRAAALDEGQAIQIFEGTNQIQRLIIAKDLLARVSA